jgi:hypothetical protein
MVRREQQKLYRRTQTAPIAVYFNPHGAVVIRQEGNYPDEDHWVYIRIENLDPLIDQLQRIARREIEP